MGSVQKHDLTTKSGYKAAMDAFENWGWVISLPGWILWKVFSPEVSTKKQTEAAIELIKAGRQQNVEKMKIKVSHQAGIDIGADVEGIPIRVKIGDAGLCEVEVEYK